MGMYDDVAGVADHAAGSVDESVGRQFDDEEGGGVADLAGKFVTPGQSDELAAEFGVEERDGPKPVGGIGPLGNAITGVGSTVSLVSTVPRLGSIGSKAVSTVKNTSSGTKLLGGGALGGVAVDDALEGGFPNPFPPLDGGSQSGGGGGGLLASPIVVIGVVLVAIVALGQLFQVEV